VLAEPDVDDARAREVTIGSSKEWRFDLAQQLVERAKATRRSSASRLAVERRRHSPL
jgi:hypothetical protein